MQIIDDVNSTIENLLKKEFNGGLPFDISFAIPRRDFAAVSSDKPTVDFYLYDIREDRELRSNEPCIERRSNGTAVKKRPPVRIRLSYCVTAWGSEREDDAVGSKTRAEHKQLSEVLAALIKCPTIPSDVLSGDLIGQEPPLPTTVVLPDGIENVAQFWNALDGILKPFLDYRVTFSLDIHKEVVAPMVAAKISEYGGMAHIYVLGIRPELQLDHPKGTTLSKANIEKTPVVALDSSATKGDNKITVSSIIGLSKDDFLMIVDGKKTEFCELGDIPAEGTEIPITRALLFDHEEGTELKRLSASSDSIDVKLAAVASSRSSELRIAGPTATKLKMGDVVRLDDSANVEYFQITQVSGPEVGLGDSDSLIQFGGIVTNNAGSGAPIVGAKITLLDGQGTYVAETTSNAEGRYMFRKLGIGKGKYTLKVEAQGYKDQQKTIAQITSAKREDLIFRLKSG